MILLQLQLANETVISKYLNILHVFVNFKITDDTRISDIFENILILLLENFHKHSKKFVKFYFTFPNRLILWEYFHF
jgi:hypothetical protein